jgi:hypothetical protein
MSRIGLTLGFYGGIAVVGWFPSVVIHAGDEEQEGSKRLIFLLSQPTPDLVKENLTNVTQTTSDLLHLRWIRVFSPSAGSVLPEKT